MDNLVERNSNLLGRVSVEMCQGIIGGIAAGLLRIVRLSSYQIALKLFQQRHIELIELVRNAIDAIEAKTI